MVVAVAGEAVTCGSGINKMATGKTSKASAGPEATRCSSGTPEVADMCPRKAKTVTPAKSEKHEFEKQTMAADESTGMCFSLYEAYVVSVAIPALTPKKSWETAAAQMSMERSAEKSGWKSAAIPEPAPSRVRPRIANASRTKNGSGMRSFAAHPILEAPRQLPRRRASQMRP